MITIKPDVGALAFSAVVILTMFATETFDPRLMWDVAAQTPDRAAVEVANDRVLDPWRELIAFVRSTSAAQVQFDLIESTMVREL